MHSKRHFKKSATPAETVGPPAAADGDRRAAATDGGRRETDGGGRGTAAADGSRRDVFLCGIKKKIIIFKEIFFQPDQFRLLFSVKYILCCFCRRLVGQIFIADSCPHPVVALLASVSDGGVPEHLCCCFCCILIILQSWVAYTGKYRGESPRFSDQRHLKIPAEWPLK